MMHLLLFSLATMAAASSPKIIGPLAMQGSAGSSTISPSPLTASQAAGTTSITVEVRMEVNDVNLALLQVMGTVRRTVPRFNAVVMEIAFPTLASLAALPAVRNIMLVEKPILNRMELSRVQRDLRVQLRDALRKRCSGSRCAGSDVSHKADQVRQVYGIDGSGIRVGVLSNGLGGAAAVQQSIDSGDIPPEGIQLVGDNTFITGAEGLAMLEIVHDIAPGAQLYFATAFGGISSFASNILDLQQAGCNVIIDDVSYFSALNMNSGHAFSLGNTPTNGGKIMEAVKTVSELGVLYFSSSGNNGNLQTGNGGSYAAQFTPHVDSGNPQTLSEVETQFGLDPNGRSSVYDSYFVHNPGTGSAGLTMSDIRTVILTWAEPLGQAGEDYALVFYDSNAFALTIDSGQSGSDDPLEFTSLT